VAQGKDLELMPLYHKKKKEKKMKKKNNRSGCGGSHQALGRLRQEDHEFKVRLGCITNSSQLRGYIARPSLNPPSKKKLGKKLSDRTHA
jgi:hypothetical protein